MSELVKILCVDDERNVLRSLERIFLDDDYEILTADSGEEGLELLERTPDVQVVISDYRMPGMNGVDFLRQVYARRPETVRIVLSGYADTAAVVAAINEGQIYKFIPKPWNDEELRGTIAKAIESFVLQKQNQQLSTELLKMNEELSLINSKLENLVSEKNSQLIQQNRLQQYNWNILHNLPVGVVTVLKDGMVSQINLEAAAILHCDSEASIGKKMQGVLAESLCLFVWKVFTDGNSSQSLTLNGEEIVVRGVYVAEEDQNMCILTLCRGGN